MILTPTLFTMNAVGFAAAGRRAWLYPTIAVSLVAMIAPAVLEATGAIAAMRLARSSGRAAVCSRW